jgi:drug/metabolite transporter (DMT)-like permease
MTQAPIFYAFNHMDIGTASLLFFVSMFLTMNAVGVGFFSERINALKYVAILMAVMGMYLVFSFSIASFTLLAALMAILNGIASGGEVAFSKKLSANYSPLYLTLLSWVIILITNGGISLALGETQLAPDFSMAWFWQLCYSIVSLFAFWLVIEGFKRVDATIGSLIGLLEIVFSVMLGILVFSEAITPSVALGGLLIICAAALPQIKAFFRSDQAGTQAAK